MIAKEGAYPSLETSTYNEWRRRNRVYTTDLQRQTLQHGAQHGTEAMAELVAFAS